MEPQNQAEEMFEVARFIYAGAINKCHELGLEVNVAFTEDTSGNPFPILYDVADGEKIDISPEDFEITKKEYNEKNVLIKEWYFDIDIKKWQLKKKVTATGGTEQEETEEELVEEEEPEEIIEEPEEEKQPEIEEPEIEEPEIEENPEEIEELEKEEESELDDVGVAWYATQLEPEEEPELDDVGALWHATKPEEIESENDSKPSIEPEPKQPISEQPKLDIEKIILAKLTINNIPQNIKDMMRAKLRITEHGYDIGDDEIVNIFEMFLHNEYYSSKYAFDMITFVERGIVSKQLQSFFEKILNQKVIIHEEIVTHGEVKPTIKLTPEEQFYKEVRAIEAIKIKHTKTGKQYNISSREAVKVVQDINKYFKSPEYKKDVEAKPESTENEKPEEPLTQEKYKKFIDEDELEKPLETYINSKLIGAKIIEEPKPKQIDIETPIIMKPKHDEQPIEITPKPNQDNVGVVQYAVQPVKPIEPISNEPLPKKPIEITPKSDPDDVGVACYATQPEQSKKIIPEPKTQSVVIEVVSTEDKQRKEMEAVIEKVQVKDKNDEPVKLSPVLAIGLMKEVTKQSKKQEEVKKEKSEDIKPIKISWDEFIKTGEMDESIYNITTSYLKRGNLRVTNKPKKKAEKIKPEDNKPIMEKIATFFGKKQTKDKDEGREKPL